MDKAPFKKTVDTVTSPSKTVTTVFLVALILVVGVPLFFLVSFKVGEAREDIPDPFLAESNEEIRAALLARLPVGSDVTEVLAVCEAEDWVVYGKDGLSAPKDFLDAPRTVLCEYGYRTESSDGTAVVGELSMDTELGSYKLSGEFYRTIVSVSWGFDADAALIDVYVKKHPNF